MAGLIHKQNNGRSSVVGNVEDRDFWHKLNEREANLADAIAGQDLGNITRVVAESADVLPDGTQISNGKYSVYTKDGTGTKDTYHLMSTGFSGVPELFDPRYVAEKFVQLSNSANLKFTSMGFANMFRDFWVQVDLGSFSLESNAKEVYDNKLTFMEQYGQHAVTRKFVETSIRVECHNLFGMVFAAKDSVSFAGSNQLLVFDALASIYEAAITNQRNFAGWMDNVYNTDVTLANDEVAMLFSKAFMPKELAKDGDKLLELTEQYSPVLTDNERAELLRRADVRSKNKERLMDRTARAINYGIRKYGDYSKELEGAGSLYWFLQAVTDLETHGVNDGGRSWTRQSHPSDGTVRNTLSGGHSDSLMNAYALVSEMM